MLTIWAAGGIKIKTLLDFSVLVLILSVLLHFHLILFFLFFSHILFSKNFHQFPEIFYTTYKFKNCSPSTYFDIKKGFSFDPSFISESWRKQRNRVSIAISYTEKKQEEMRYAVIVMIRVGRRGKLRTGISTSVVRLEMDIDIPSTSKSDTFFRAVLR